MEKKENIESMVSSLEKHKKQSFLLETSFAGAEEESKPEESKESKFLFSEESRLSLCSNPLDHGGAV